MLGPHPGLLVQPADARWLYVLAHGAGAGMRHAFMTELAGRLAQHQIATLRWEFPYMAAGKPRPDRAEVAEAAVREVWSAARERFGELPMFAGGKSFGGRMTSRAHAALALPALRGIAFLGFPLHPPEKPAPKMERPGFIPGRGPKMERPGFIPGRGIERAEHLATANGPLLFLQGTRDDLADLALLRPVIAKLGTRATLHVVEGADHGFDVLVRSGRTHEDVMSELARTLATWFARVGLGASRKGRERRTR